MSASNCREHLPSTIYKSPTGIAGMDDIMQGGLPTGRSTLICGGPGCGKTLFGIEFLVHGARRYNEPGLFVSFSETKRQLIDDSRSLGFDVEGLIEHGKLLISEIALSPEEMIESGSFSLDGLFIRIDQSIKQIGVKRVVLDSVETVFSVLADSSNLRHEIARLFHWLQHKGVTTVVTSERGTDSLSRYGFEEYVSDCVILLDFRVTEQIAKRRLRVVKYRGSGHGTDEYPFMIGAAGISVLPITSVALDYSASEERISTGIRDLDLMFGENGYFRGSSILTSGKAGTGKSTLAAAFALASCKRGERCLYFAFEESADQIRRNMRSVGMDLTPWIEQGSLAIRATRPDSRGLEEHLFAINTMMCERQPQCVVIDPITSFINVGSSEEVKAMLLRMIDNAKQQCITVFSTALTPGTASAEETETSISSLVDTWIALDMRLVGHTRYRELLIIKSRGMYHSHETRRLVLSSTEIGLGELPDQEK